MAKLSLTTRPGPFTKTVKVPTPSGEPLDLTVTFVYRTRTELAKYNDEYMERSRARTQAILDKAREDADAAVKAAQEKAKEAEESGGTVSVIDIPQIKPMSDFSMAEAFNVAGAEYVTAVLEGWDLEVELNLANAQKLCDLYPGAVQAIAEVYNKSLKDGRSGN
jgi:hypothetical protein